VILRSNTARRAVRPDRGHRVANISGSAKILRPFGSLAPPIGTDNHHSLSFPAPITSHFSLFTNHASIFPVAQFELIIGLLLVGTLLAGIARRLKLPYLVLLALIGLALAFTPGLPDLTLDPQLTLTLFVAPVLLDAAYDASLRDLKDHWWPVATLTLIAVGLTVVSVAVVLRLFLPHIPWAAAVALGAIVAPTDASAATAVLRVLRPSHRVLVILEGESLFNDASALLIYRAAVGVAASGTITGEIPSLLLAGVASIVAGIALAHVFLPIGLRMGELGAAILMQFLTVFLVWMIADALHLSPIITMVCFAITLARYAPTKINAQRRIPSYAVWEVMVFALNILIFIFVGLELKPLLQRLNPKEWNHYLLIGGTVCATTILIRIAWVMFYNSVVRLKNRFFGTRLPRRVSPPTIQSGIIVAWCGMRGIITLAAALALPDTFPYRDLLLFTAFAVVLGTLILQGLTLRPLMMALRFAGDRVIEDEVRLARVELTRAALQVLDGEQVSEALAAVRREYEARLATDTVEAHAGTNVVSELALIQSRAIAGERRTLDQLRNRGDIGDDAFHRLEEELDWAEVYALRSAGGAGAESD
jgi:monovalent cation/hydrogen antiporter